MIVELEVLTVRVGDLLHEWVHHDRNHLRQILANVQDELLSPLSPNERRQLIRLLTRLLEHHTDASSEP